MNLLNPMKVLLCAVLATGAASTAQDSANRLRLETLLQQLQDHRTSRSASAELSTLGQADPAARRFLASHVPGILHKTPVDPYEILVWCDEAVVAGKLKLVEAIPALAEGIGIDRYSDAIQISPGDTMTFGQKAAVAALIRIGPPSIPAVTKVLNQGGSMQRREAAYVLGVIGTPAARKALQEALPREVDPDVRKYVQDALNPPKWWPSYSDYTSVEP